MRGIGRGYWRGFAVRRRQRCRIEFLYLLRRVGDDSNKRRRCLDGRSDNWKCYWGLGWWWRRYHRGWRRHRSRRTVNIHIRLVMI